MNKSKFIILAIIVACSFVWIFLPYWYLATYIFPGDTGYTAAVLMQYTVIAWFALFLPSVSFGVARKWINQYDTAKQKIIYSLLYSFLFALPYLFYRLRFSNISPYIYFAMVTWSFLWGMLGLIRKKPKSSADAVIGQDQA